ncbi:hypothetical protein HMI54_003969 [Coelomomyces lativittatus]|nr:hypothetical protein HMI54_003969 [Coelomomyces lativittatus]KAJ1515853.1 hypothetical protein HMI55_003292 [Coelomomyces lativittatus]
MSYQVSDTKKEDFRKYLERNGILDTLTKVLVGLYEEPDKPENPLDYMKHFLSGPSDVDVEAMKAEIADLHKQVETLTAELNEFKKGAINSTSNSMSSNGTPNVTTSENNEPVTVPAIDLNEPENASKSETH